MKKINSRAKGKAGELELAHKLQEYGFNARRSQQYAGINNDADVVGLPYVHCEVKRVEQLNLYKAMEQSANDARNGEVPMVFHRKNHQKWLVTMRFEDFMDLYIKAYGGPEKNESN